MPEKYREMKPYKPRGVSNRNAALEFIRHNIVSGVFYLADDDNTYDYRLFEQVTCFKLNFRSIIYDCIILYS